MASVKCPVVANALAWKAQNKVACNASSFEIGVGDKVTVDGKTGFVKAKYFKGSKICIDIDIGSKTVTVEPKDVMKNSAPVAMNADKFLRGIDFGGDAYGKLFVDGDMSFYINPNSMKGAFNIMLGSPDKVIGEAKKALNGARNMVHYLEKIIPWLEKNAIT